MCYPLGMRASKQRGPCWEWGGGTDKDGYGVWAGRRAHRVVYEELIGIPEGLDLHHRCENKRCVNPWHLEPELPGRHAKIHGAPGLVAHAAARRAANSQCPQGHDYTKENTYEYVRKDGRRERHCRRCHRDRMRDRYVPRD